MENLQNAELENINGGDDFLYDVGYVIGSTIRVTSDYFSELSYALRTVNWFGVS